MKNIIENKNIRKYYTVGYDGDDKTKQVIDFVLTSMLATAMVSIFLLVIISHILGGK